MDPVAGLVAGRWSVISRPVSGARLQPAAVATKEEEDCLKQFLAARGVSRHKYGDLLARPPTHY